MCSRGGRSPPLPPLLPLSSDPTVKRLDFDNVPVPAPTSPRSQALEIRRELERCRDDVSDISELVEPLKLTASQYADVDPSKLWDEYVHLKNEVLRVHAENLLLESYLEPESSVEDANDSDLQVLENQLADVRSALTKETQEIGCLIDTFAAAMENFPLLMESVSSHFEECDRKFQSQEGYEQLGNKLNDVLLNSEADNVECQAYEFRKRAGEIEIQIMKLEDENTKKEEFYKQLQNLHEMHAKLNLLKKVMTFFSDWIVDSCEENMVTFTFRSSSPKQKKVVHSKHQQKPAKELMYRLLVSINFKSFVVENVQWLEPKNEAPRIDDILKEMTFRRTMHSVEAHHEAHNDLEFLLRRLGQRIVTLKNSSL